MADVKEEKAEDEEVLDTPLKVLYRFRDDTSIMGVKNVKLKDNKWTRTSWIMPSCWLIAILILGGVLLWQVVQNFQQYYSYPSSTTYAESNRDLIFPDVTICNIYPFASDENKALKPDDFKDFVEQTINKENVTSWGIESDEIYLNKLKESLTYGQAILSNLHSATDLPTFHQKFIPDCTLNTWREETQDCSIFDKNVTMNKTVDPQYSLCYTLHIKNDTPATNIKSMSLIVSLDDILTTQDIDFYNYPSVASVEGVRVALHSPGTKPDLSKAAVNAGTGFETTIKFVPIYRERLKTPYSPPNCTESTFLEDTETELYSYVGCHDVCVQHEIVNNCSCVSALYDYTDKQWASAGNMLCENISFLDQNKDSILRGLKNYLCFYELDLDETDTNCWNKCLLPCKETLYDVVPNSAKWPHITFLNNIKCQYLENWEYDHDYTEVPTDDDGELNFDDVYVQKNNNKGTIVKTKKLTDVINNKLMKINIVAENRHPIAWFENKTCTVDVFLSQLGGTTSLWLGITAMFLVEIIEVIYNLIRIRCPHRPKPKNTTSHKENDKELALNR